MLDTNHTSGNAQQNVTTTPSVMRIVGHLLATFKYSIIFWLGGSVISTLLFEIAFKDAACNVEKVRLGHDYLGILPCVIASNPTGRWGPPSRTGGNRGASLLRWKQSGYSPPSALIAARANATASF